MVGPLRAPPTLPPPPPRLPDDVLARRDQLPVKPAAVVLTGEAVELRPLDLDADVAVLHAGSSGPDGEARVWLLLAHVFALGYRRAEWKCDALNTASRIVKGRNRDTAWYRMLDREWATRASAPAPAPTR